MKSQQRTKDAPDWAALEGGGGPWSIIISVRCGSSFAIPYVPPVACTNFEISDLQTVVMQSRIQMTDDMLPSQICRQEHSLNSYIDAFLPQS
jgi:hypothetical protein